MWSTLLCSVREFIVKPAVIVMLLAAFLIGGATCMAASCRPLRGLQERRQDRIERRQERRRDLRQPKQSQSKPVSRRVEDVPRNRTVPAYRAPVPDSCAVRGACGV